jgi:CheY-like chemotaxis protein
MNLFPCPPPNILVAEDDAKLCELMVESLADFGFEATAAPSGRKALDRIRERKPDLLLCDVMMPDGDGHDVLRVIRGDQQLADLPVIFLSALARVSDVRAGMNLGADDYLTKPVALVELRRAVEARLTRVQLMRGNSADPVDPDSSPRAGRGRFPWPWPDLPMAPAGLGLLDPNAGAPRVDAVRAGELAEALCRPARRASDLLLMVRPGWVQCPPGLFEAVVGTLLGYVLLHSRSGDAVWLVGGWDGERYQLTLWSREGGGNLPRVGMIADEGRPLPAGLARPLDDLGLRRAAAMLRQYGGELQLQDCGADGVRLHAHFQPVPPVP